MQDVASSRILALVQAQAAVLEQRRVITSSLYGAASCTAYGLQRALLLIECRLNATKKSASSSKVVTRGIWSDIELLPILGLRLQAFSSVLNCSQSLDHQGLGHRAIQHTARYTELSPTRFRDVWR